MRNLQKYQQDYELVLRDELLANLYESKGYFSYKHPVTGQSIHLGKNQQTAVRLAMQLNVGLSPLDNKVLIALKHSENNFTKSGKTFSDFVRYYQNNILLNKQLKDSTLRNYRYCFNHFAQTFGSRDINQITLADISTFLAKYPPSQSNHYRAALSALWKHAVAEGLVSENIPAKTLKKRVTVQRLRLPFDAFLTIRKFAPDWLQNAMDLALLTGQRVGDIANLNCNNIQDSFLFIKQSKTGQALKLPIIGQLATVINRCLINDCDYLISIKNKQITSGYISKSFCNARKESGFYDNVEHPPTFHEIRSLSAHLQESGGLDKKEIQKWLGHASEKMTDLYLSRRESFKTVSPESMLQLSQLITL
jgi:integrase